MAQSTYFAPAMLFGIFLVSAGTASNVASASLTTLPIARPQGLDFPSAWTFSSAAPATDIWGLTQYLYYVDASVSAVQHWAQQPDNRCTDDAVTSSSALFDVNTHTNPQSPTLLWFCADATRLYSFLLWDTQLHSTVLWAVSERQIAPDDTLRDRFSEFLHALGAEQVHQSSTAFEQLSVYQTGRTLLALKADLNAYVKRYGLQVNDQQAAHNGLVMSWQQGPLRTQISAVRQADGRVVLTQVTGTNL